MTEKSVNLVEVLICEGKVEKHKEGGPEGSTGQEVGEHSSSLELEPLFSRLVGISRHFKAFFSPSEASSFKPACATIFQLCQNTSKSHLMNTRR